MTVDVVFQGGAWHEICNEIAEQVEGKVFSYFGLDQEQFEASILFADDEVLKDLNQRFRGKNKATDVLSWPAQEFERELGQRPNLPSVQLQPFATTLGDIALGWETCNHDAKDGKFNEHITHLIIHGYLHLLGYDHEHDLDAVIMERIEVEILEKLGIDKPYD